jgi:hypothetical protein
MRLLPWENKSRLKKEMEVKPVPIVSGYRFSLKGSPRHYDDVTAIIEASGAANVYFGEALHYERGAAIALWRIKARGFDWLRPLYDWWVEMERIEPIQFTFHLYMPDNSEYAVLDLREHSANDVEQYIRAHAPWDGRGERPSTGTLSSGQPNLESH